MLQISDDGVTLNAESCAASSSSEIKEAPKYVLKITRGGTLSPTALENLPYLITPRESHILAAKPILRWNKVAGANSYTVKVGGVNWEKQEIANTEVKYDGVTPFKEGWRYAVTITDNNGVSSDKEGKFIGFVYLMECERKLVLESAKKIESQFKDPAQRALALAKLYRSYMLYADAIEVLVIFTEKNKNIAEAYHLLGDTYLRSDLILRAKAAFDKGLGLAANAKNELLKADIHTGIGLSLFFMGQYELAKSKLGEAITSYERLLKNLKTEQIKAKIEDVNGYLKKM